MNCVAFLSLATKLPSNGYCSNSKWVSSLSMQRCYKYQPSPLSEHKVMHVYHLWALFRNTTVFKQIMSQLCYILDSKIYMYREYKFSSKAELVTHVKYHATNSSILTETSPKDLQLEIFWILHLFPRSIILCNVHIMVLSSCCVMFIDQHEVKP